MLRKFAAFWIRLNNSNRDRNFRDFRESNILTIALVIGILGTLLVIGFFYLEIIQKYKNSGLILVLRIITSALIIMITSVVLFFKKPAVTKAGIYAGASITAIYLSFLTYLSSANYPCSFDSPYWVGIIMLTIAWLSFIPFPYAKMLLSGLAYITQYSVILVLLDRLPPDWSKIIVINSFLVGVYLISAAVCVYNNYSSLQLYNNKKEQERLNGELGRERRALKRRNDDIEADLKIARRIQMSLIPSKCPRDGIACYYKPMDRIGGDFFDFFSFRQRELTGIFISDVSGHGISAALITSMLKSAIMQADYDTRKDPAGLLSYLNECLNSQTGGNFITAFCCVHNSDSKKISYSNAGHNPPLLIGRKGVSYLEQDRRSPPLAVFSNGELSALGKSYKNSEIFPDRILKIMFYTDGLTETIRNGDNRSDPLVADFEHVRLMSALMDSAGLPAADFTNGLIESLLEFRGSSDFDDDICMICMDME